ncbi:hypothetical protein [Actinacidiphila glaucinigra]|uniref:hypothetical protein n=1 Tax=Actinacidiphila glaucinigra TaxID=235986 RepID=UPI0036E37FD6
MKPAPGRRGCPGPGRPRRRLGFVSGIQGPYTPLYEALPALRCELITPDDVAAAVADTIERPAPALRVPVGAPAEKVLRARKEALEDEPFLATEINW